MNVYITGCGGLIGSAVVEAALGAGAKVWGTDSDARGAWFGPGGSVASRLEYLESEGATIHRHDFRLRPELVEGADLIVHCAGQPSHDFSRDHVLLDSLTNYIGTVELLEATRRLAPKAHFAFLSTNKVYGDQVNNRLFDPLGVDETMSIDTSQHTPFGVSKAAADLMVQEYARTFGLTTLVLRCGCMTGSGGAAVELQGFLGYLVKCAVSGKPYTIYGYDGKQVRDNICAFDVAQAILAWHRNPKGCVYNMGGGPANVLRVNDAISYLTEKHGCCFKVERGPSRVGDHRWWVTDITRFQEAYPEWKITRTVWQVIDDMVAAAREQMGAAA